VGDPLARQRVSDLPVLAAQWHPTRNGGRQPSGVRASSKDRVWWRCEAGHEWQAPVVVRATRDPGCPECRTERLGGRDIGAGASANAEYESRLARHQERVRAERPVTLVLTAAAAIAGVVIWSSAHSTFGLALLAVAVILVLGLLVTPNSVTAWSTGAEGERLTARQLAQLEPDGFVILHDRRMPGSRRANIDHVVIGPPGVFVVETKSLSGKVEVRGDDVYVAGRRRTRMLDEARREAMGVGVALAAELEELELGVTPVIVVHRARLPFFRSVAGGIRIVSGSDLVGALRGAEPVLSPEEVEWLASTADSHLVPAGGGERQGV
jgi:hypothetical protein